MEKSFPDYVRNTAFKKCSGERIGWANISAEILNNDPSLCQRLLHLDPQAMNSLRHQLTENGKRLRKKRGYTTAGITRNVTLFFKQNLLPKIKEYNG